MRYKLIGKYVLLSKALCRGHARRKSLNVLECDKALHFDGKKRSTCISDFKLQGAGGEKVASSFSGEVACRRRLTTIPCYFQPLEGISWT